ncbi:unnamed protein product, partial [Polarella glacialis]
ELVGEPPPPEASKEELSAIARRRLAEIRSEAVRLAEDVALRAAAAKASADDRLRQAAWKEAEADALQAEAELLRRDLEAQDLRLKELRAEERRSSFRATRKDEVHASEATRRADAMAVQHHVLKVQRIWRARQELAQRKLRAVPPLAAAQHVMWRVSALLRAPEIVETLAYTPSVQLRFGCVSDASLKRDSLLSTPSPLTDVLRFEMSHAPLRLSWKLSTFLFPANTLWAADHADGIMIFPDQVLVPSAHPPIRARIRAGCVAAMHVLCLMSLLALASSSSTCTPSDHSISRHSDADGGDKISFLSLRLGPGLSQHLQTQAGQEAAAAALEECLLQQEVNGSDRGVNAFFGTSVSISGNFAIVGATLSLWEPLVSVELDRRSTPSERLTCSHTMGAWSQQSQLFASANLSESAFGASVSISHDTAIVGAPGAPGAPGAAYAFTRTGTTWSPATKLSPSFEAANDFFGGAVSIFGKTAIVGAPRRRDTKEGAAYVFVLKGSTWSQTATLVANERVPNDNFGTSVGISGDSVIVGASTAAASIGMSVGTAYVFKFDGTPIGGRAYVFTRIGMTWKQTSELFGNNGAENDMFGGAVSIFGKTAIVGNRGVYNSQGKAREARAAECGRSGIVPGSEVTSVAVPTALKLFHHRCLSAVGFPRPVRIFQTQLLRRAKCQRLEM